MSPSKRKDLEDKLARLNSRYVLGSSNSATNTGKKSATDVGKVGLAALQDIAARQEAALLTQQLEDITPTNMQKDRVGDAGASAVRFNPGSRKMVDSR